MKNIRNLPLIAAIILIGIAAFGFFSIIRGITNNEEVMVAAATLEAYTFINQDDLATEEVPESAIQDNMLTRAEYEELFFDEEGRDQGTVITYPFLEGQWIVEGGLSKDPENTFAVVLPDERVAAVTASATGAGLGTIRPGDVVTATKEDSGGDRGVIVEYAKVLCITTKANGCTDVLPGSRGAAESSEEANEGSFYILLAVPTDFAPAISGSAVALTQDPFCRVGPEGQFIGDQCQPPDDREASSEISVFGVG